MPLICVVFSYLSKLREVSSFAVWKMHNKTMIEFGCPMISQIIEPQTLVLIIHDIMLNLIQ